ncbi:MAG: hypothetical protein QM628_11500 [Propionicimonas sp.]
MIRPRTERRTNGRLCAAAVVELSETRGHRHATDGLDPSAGSG